MQLNNNMYATLTVVFTNRNHFLTLVAITNVLKQRSSKILKKNFKARVNFMDRVQLPQGYSATTQR